MRRKSATQNPEQNRLYRAYERLTELRSRAGQKNDGRIVQMSESMAKMDLKEIDRFLKGIEERISENDRWRANLSSPKNIAACLQIARTRLQQLGNTKEQLEKKGPQIGDGLSFGDGTAEKICTIEEGYVNPGLHRIPLTAIAAKTTTIQGHAGWVVTDVEAVERIEMTQAEAEALGYT